MAGSYLNYTSSISDGAKDIAQTMLRIDADISSLEPALRDYAATGSGSGVAELLAVTQDLKKTIDAHKTTFMQIGQVSESSYQNMLGADQNYARRMGAV
jgi:hypothetical protein